MGNFSNKLKTGAFYLYLGGIYLIIFLILWFISYTFLFPNIYNFMIKAFLWFAAAGVIEAIRLALFH